MSNKYLDLKLREWVLEKEKNGIKQHSRKWKDGKVYTVGGSSIATIQGKNPYSDINKMIREKIGLSRFMSDIKPQWGNLFEDVIKRYIEHDKKCVVLGEDLYMTGPGDTSYSPDGLAVLDYIEEYGFEEETIIDTPDGPKKSIQIVPMAVPKTAIALLEFKCPFSRIPSGRVPEYYVPQVKMGLDLLQLPTIGLFAEGVFRRCTWDQIGNNPLYDRTLVPRSSGKLPLAYGILGFVYDEPRYKRELEKLRMRKETSADADVAEAQKSKLWALYDEQFVEKGDNTNSYLANDLGEAPPELFTLIMDSYDKKILRPWYGSIIFVDSNMISNNGKASVDDIAKKLASMNISEPAYDENAAMRILNDDLTKFSSYCAENGYTNFGIIPWKLFRVDYNFIQPEENYIQPWLPKIKEVMDVVRKCNDPANADRKNQIYLEYVNRYQYISGGFSDEM